MDQVNKSSPYKDLPSLILVLILHIALLGEVIQSNLLKFETITTLSFKMDGEVFRLEERDSA